MPEEPNAYLMAIERIDKNIEKIFDRLDNIDRTIIMQKNEHDNLKGEVDGIKTFAKNCIVTVSSKARDAIQFIVDNKKPLEEMVTSHNNFTGKKKRISDSVIDKIVIWGVALIIANGGKILYFFIDIFKKSGGNP